MTPAQFNTYIKADHPEKMKRVPFNAKNPDGPLEICLCTDCGAVLMLDEPSLGLSPLVVDLIFNQIKDMNRQGISFLVVEQNARKGLSVSHRGYVLELGRNRLTGPGRDLLENPELQRLYLGG